MVPGGVFGWLRKKAVCIEGIGEEDFLGLAVIPQIFLECF
jgi:hypothetical protein